jgi:hypothetical protein
MPAPRILPPSDVLLQMRNSGHTYEDIANEFGVSKGAVYLQLRQARATDKRPSYKHLIPWTVRTDHAHAHPVTMLRLLGRRQKGETLPPVKSRLLDKWLEGMAENGLVLCYHPDAPPNPASRSTGGFYYKRREESDGDSLVRAEDSTFAAATA